MAVQKKTLVGGFEVPFVGIRHAFGGGRNPFVDSIWSAQYGSVCWHVVDIGVSSLSFLFFSDRFSGVWGLFGGFISFFYLDSFVVSGGRIRPRPCLQ